MPSHVSCLQPPCLTSETTSSTPSSVPPLKFLIPSLFSSLHSVPSLTQLSLGGTQRVAEWWRRGRKWTEFESQMPQKETKKKKNRIKKNCYQPVRTLTADYPNFAWNSNNLWQAEQRQGWRSKRIDIPCLSGRRNKENYNPPSVWGDQSGDLHGDEMAEHWHIEGDWGDAEYSTIKLNGGGRAANTVALRQVCEHKQGERREERMHLFFQDKWEVEGLQTVGILLVVCSSLKLMHFLGLIDLSVAGKTRVQKARARCIEFVRIFIGVGWGGGGHGEDHILTERVGVYREVRVWICFSE